MSSILLCVLYMIFLFFLFFLMDFRKKTSLSLKGPREQPEEVWAVPFFWLNKLLLEGSASETVRKIGTLPAWLRFVRFLNSTGFRAIFARKHWALPVKSPALSHSQLAHRECKEYMQTKKHQSARKASSRAAICNRQRKQHIAREQVARARAPTCTKLAGEPCTKGFVRDVLHEKCGPKSLNLILLCTLQ